MPDLITANQRDASLEKTGALPNGDATTYTAALDLGTGLIPPDMELEITVPALTTTEAPDTRTLTVALVQGSTTTPTTKVSASTVLTGAGGAGIAKTRIRVKPLPNGGRYVRAEFDGGASFGNASGKSGVLMPLF
jgi:hypothetical protein